MNLATYMRRKKLKLADVATAVGVDVSQVSRFRSGARIPNRETLRRIVEWSGGRITPNDFYGFISRRSSSDT